MGFGARGLQVWKNSVVDSEMPTNQPRVAVSGKKFEDVVDSVRPSAVLILVY